VIRINLLPIEERATREEASGGLWLVAALGAVAGVAVLVLGAFTLQTRALSSLTDEMERLEKLSAQYRPLIERVNQLSAERKELETKMQVIDQLDQERSYRVHLLEELNEQMPRYAWLTKFVEVGGASAEIEGSTFSNLVVADFITGLERSDLYDQVDLSVAKKGEVGAVDIVAFKLTALLTKPPADAPGDATTEISSRLSPPPGEAQ
jgi:Tfp pilus assembly protein PilN